MNPIKKMLRPMTAVMYRSKSVRQWPKLPARLLDIKTPSSVVPKAEDSPSGEANINILLDFVDRTRDIPGSVAECGVFRGQSLLSMALYQKQSKIEKHTYGFDSFEGFDDTVEKDILLGGAADTEKREGGFSDTSYEFVSARAKMLDLESCLSIHKGFFKDSLMKVEDQVFSFVHLDCDIYESYKQCLEFFYDRLSPGAIVLFDEYCDPPWPGCNQAIDEFMADKVEKIEKVSSDNYIKYYFVKT